MQSKRMRALRRVACLAALLGGWLLGVSAPANACEGGGDYLQCKSYWLDALYYPCLELECAGIPPGPEYQECRRECWDQYLSASNSDCSNCPSP